MARGIIFVAILATAHARRITRHLTLHNDMSDGSAQKVAQCDWPEEFVDRYSLIKKLGAGQHGCVYLAEDIGTGRQLAVKVSNESHLPNENWVRTIVRECREMRFMRYEACKAGKEILQLQETYLPSCEDAGHTSSGLAYLVLPFAGGLPLGEYEFGRWHTWPLTFENQKSLFAQFVGAVYSMHGLNIWHGDLHTKNILLDGEFGKENKLAVIDFGLATTSSCTQPRCLGGYSRDGNALWRWLAIFANCPGDARYVHKWWQKVPPEEQKPRQDKTLKCVEKNWNPDASFLIALSKVFDANVEEDTNMFVGDLYKTAFVQDHLPPARSDYVLPGTEECHAWPLKKINAEMKLAGAVAPYAG